MSPALKKVETLSYEAAFTELEAIVAALEAEGHALDESIALYERGQALAAHCARPQRKLPRQPLTCR